MNLRILADSNILFAKEAFTTLGPTRLLEGHLISPESVRNCDVLLTRSGTQINRELIAESQLNFVGSATVGTDHVDQSALSRAGIAFAHAKGAGTESVAEYVAAAMIIIADREQKPCQDLILGIVGYGNIGKRVYQRARGLGMRVLINDPPLQNSYLFEHVPIEKLLWESDIITLHVPLVFGGEHPTYHLLNHTAIKQIKRGGWLINTSRGSVVDNHALLSQNHLGGIILDVWENEPEPYPDLIRKVSLGTPHIAGHSFDGKLLGTILVYQAVVRHFGLRPTWDYASLQRPTKPSTLSSPPKATSPEKWLNGVTRMMYDLEGDSDRMRSLLDAPPELMGRNFRALRSAYPPRRAFRLHQMPARMAPSSLHSALTRGLKVTLT